MINVFKKNAFPLRSEARQICLLLPYLFNIALKVLATINFLKKHAECLDLTQRHSPSFLK